MFYSSIAQNYNYIFPKNRKQLSFIKSIVENRSLNKILDVGSATGNLTSLLKELSDNVYGIELDSELISIAKKSVDASFFKLNMLDLESKFTHDSFSLVVSFGNTLVHLGTLEEVKKYFISIFNILETDGYFITQIINYDRVENENIKSLPTIENEKIKFVRDYSLVDEGRFVNFETELTIKEENRKVNGKIKLLTLKKREIENLLLDVGFTNIKFYGDFNGGELKPFSVPLIFSCKKN
ncbi:MAG: hypothetical protein CR982_07250 [Candidatus Cloacimonadota bacterium]|nr:MAG: hypothetical protein CR982_07250 [Candidatus Cloacimonadota bacterium]